MLVNCHTPGSGWENADPNRPVDLEPKATIFGDQKGTDLTASGRGFRSRRRSKDHPIYIERDRAREEPPDPMMDPVLVSSRMKRKAHNYIEEAQQRVIARLWIRFSSGGTGSSSARGKQRVLRRSHREDKQTNPYPYRGRESRKEARARIDIRGIGPVARAPGVCVQQDEETPDRDRELGPVGRVRVRVFVCGRRETTGAHRGSVPTFLKLALVTISLIAQPCYAQDTPLSEDFGLTTLR
jgi:hypothetical protein